MPFEVPDGWCWCRLDDLCTFLSRGKSPVYSDTDRRYPVFAQKCNLKDGGISLEKAQFLDPTTLNRWPEIYHLRTGDVLVNSTGTGTVGRTRLFDDSCLGKYAFVVPDSHVSVIRTHVDIVSEYIYALMSSTWIQTYMEDNLAGSTNQKELYIGVLQNMDVPLPPINEQSRIAAKLIDLERIISVFEKSESALSVSITTAKSKILDLAIHGKLVPQDPKDEPASELLKRINPNAVTSCDNPHYTDLPRGWVMLKGKDLFKPMKSTKPSGETFKYIDIDSINNKNGVVTAPKILKSSDAPSRATRFTVKGDIVFSMVRPYLRNIAIVPENGCIASTGFYVCSPNGVMSSDYCYYLMTSNYVVEGLNKYMKGDNSPSINNNHINEWLFPVPPLKEQVKIVSKLQDILSQLDSIMSSLQA